MNPPRVRFGPGGRGGSPAPEDARPRRQSERSLCEPRPLGPFLYGDSSEGAAGEGEESGTCP